MAGSWQSYTTAAGKATRWYLRTQPWTIFAIGSGRAYGCVAIKRELDALGHGSGGFRTDSPVIGDAADAVIREFQRAAGQTVDGIVGPNTAEALFAERIAAEERARGIPSRWGAKMVKLESAEDPGASGWDDPNDKGLVEINVKIRPVTIAQAYDPAFAIPYLCQDLADAHADLKDWAGAVASWNTGGYWARRWVDAGKPTSGAWDPKNSIDWFTRASHYVELVTEQVLRA